MINIRNERADITLRSTDTNIIKKQYNQIYINKFDYTDEIDKFPKRCNLLNLIKN